MASSGGKKDFHAIRSELLRKRSLFIDQDFPPDSRSLTYSGLLPAGLPVRRVEWKRPPDIVRNPKFVVSVASRADTDQGMLGNCWFVAGAALLANGPRQQFERVVPFDQGFDPQTYAGIFRFNFWWYGHWKEVIIDDYLPTDGSRLIYSQNFEEKNEFWAALLEKAYAKLRGCYEALDGGKLQDSLVDFTGGLSETIDLRDKSNLPANLFDLVWRTFNMNSMMGGSIYLPDGARRAEVRKQNGLYMGHAYSITSLAVVPHRGSTEKLLRLRNPWGRKEWMGPWSDGSPEIRNMTEENKRKLKIVIEEEGEFWISFNDFLANFDEMQLCHLQPDAIGSGVASAERKQSWSVTNYHDAWIKGVTAGGCGNSPYQDLYWKNPQFQVHLKDPDDSDDTGMCTVVVSLMEKEGMGKRKTSIAIGFDVYQLRDPQNRPMDGESASRNALIHRKQSGTYQHYREVVRRFQLPPGHYVIIPSTFHPHEDAEFLLRIYTEKEIESEVMDEDNKPTTPVAAPTDFLAGLFQRHAGGDGQMDSKELRSFLAEATEKEFNEAILFNREACRSLVTMLDLNQTGYLDLEQGKKVFEIVKTNTAVFRQFDKDRSNSVDTLELGTMFSKLGFPVSRTVLTSIVRRYGGRDRKIDLEDFICVLCKLVTMFSIFEQQSKKTGGPDDVAQFTRNEFLQYTMFC